MRSLVFIFLLGLRSVAQEAMVQMRDGRELRGSVAMPEVTIHAPYGSVRVETGTIAQLRFGTGSETDALLTLKGLRFSGFITEPMAFKPPEDEAMMLRKFQVESMRQGRIHLTNESRWLVLANGDLLAGEFALPSLTITNAAGAEAVPAETIDSIWFSPNESMVAVQLIDGKEAHAAWAQPAIRLKLDTAQELEIPRTMLKAIYWRRGAVPPELARFAAAAASDKGPEKGASGFPAPPRMVWISPGAVVLGSPLDERGRNSDEDPRTHVTLTRGFWMAQYEVTQGEYAAIMGVNPSTFQGDTNRPVEKVSWHDANDYCARLTEAARADGALPPGYVYRLPTEAEWEYACRAGSTTRFSFGADPDERELREYAWFVGNSGWTTHPVGQLKPNRWGLYDMHGNVLEWCAGIWNQSYPGGQVTNYNGAAEGWLRVARGGSWLYGAAFARSANRDDYGAGNRCSDLGFRVVLGPAL